MEDGRKAVLLGASGLVGSHCLKRLCADPTYARIVVVTRRKLTGDAAHPKTTQVIVDFDRLEEASDRLVGDDVFCAFGTTIEKAGSREDFRRIDLDYPAELGRITRRNGARHFSLVSSRGADSGSRLFYLRVKGDLENAITNQGWPSVAVLRPSVIGGHRDEVRVGERIAQFLLQFAPASLRTVPADSIARKMLQLAHERPTGVRIVESQEIVRT